MEIRMSASYWWCWIEVVATVLSSLPEGEFGCVRQVNLLRFAPLSMVQTQRERLPDPLPEGKPDPWPLHAYLYHGHTGGAEPRWPGGRQFRGEHTCSAASPSFTNKINLLLSSGRRGAEHFLQENGIKLSFFMAKIQTLGRDNVGSCIGHSNKSAWIINSRLYAYPNSINTKFLLNRE